MTQANARTGRSAADLDAGQGPDDLSRQAQTPPAPAGPASAADGASAESARADGAAQDAASHGAAADGVGSHGAAGGGAAADATYDDVIEALKDVVDPELGINIVDLGLVYDVVIDSGVATLDMTLTSAACPLTDMIEDQVRAALVGVGGATGLVDDFRINWVWMPPWDLTKITDDGRDQLRALGFSI